MASQDKMERDLLCCSICLDLLNEPKTLPCMHRFCKSCLEGHIVNSDTRAFFFPPGFSCPVCRQLIPAPDISSPPSSWAGLFQTDFMVKSLVEIHTSKQKACIPKFSHPCPKHEDEEQELYCFDCSTTVCHLCVVISHRGCRKIDTVTEAAQQRRASWQEYIQQMLINALGIEKFKESSMKKIKKDKVCVENKIKEAAEKLHTTVKEEAEQLLKQVQGNYDNLQRKALAFEKQIKKLKSDETKLSTSSDFELMVDDVSLTIDYCSQQNQAFNKDYHPFCEALSSVKWRFRKQNISRFNLGILEFECDDDD